MTEIEMVGTEIVSVVRDGDVGIVEMCRPPHNLLEATLLDALTKGFQQAVDGGCRSILLTSGLRHFCAGADLDAMLSGGLGKLDLYGFLHRLERLPIPTVAAVHGAALGGGFELALGCDLIIAADTAEIGLVETTLGLFPLMGGVQRVAARAGLGRAKEIALLGRRHSPATLERWGIVNQVVPAEAIREAGLSVARQLAAGPTVAYRAIRTIADHAASHGVHAADAITAEVEGPVWESADLQAGLAAFVATGTANAVFRGE
jgi:enoyl-CoA hydratase/carnithine racemase